MKKLSQSRRREESLDLPPVIPQNLEAERAVLGSILVNNAAFHRVAPIVKADDFFRRAHQAVYQSMVVLVDTDRVHVDLVTLKDHLAKRGLLDECGGPAYIAALTDGVPRSANAEYYAGIVAEFSRLRALIRIGNEMVSGAYAASQPAQDLITAADRAIVGLQRGGYSDRLRKLGDGAYPLMEDIERRADNRGQLTGVDTGFHSINELTLGWQIGDMNIIAARPSIGKTSLVLNSAIAAARSGKHVAIFSLEMRLRQLEYRMLSTLSQIPLTRIKGGFMGDDDKRRVYAAAGEMREFPIYIDDRGDQSAWDIRAACRRLKAEGALDLVVIDYVQLMRGTSDRKAANRNEELGDISRRVKVLADDVSVPILLLSQLSRAGDARSDKRPQLSDLRDSGCIPASTLIWRADTNERISVEKLVLSQEQPIVWALDEHWKMVPAKVVKTFPSGIKPVFRLKLRSGRSVEATGNHPLRTINGWTPLEEISVGQQIAVPRCVHEATQKSESIWAETDRLVLLAHLLGDGSIGPKGVKYVTSDPHNKKAVEDASFRLLSVVPKSTRSKSDTYWDLWFPAGRRLTHGVAHPVRDWLEPWGLWGSRSWNKFIPEPIAGLPKDKIALFLRHLWATDGSITLSKNGQGRVVRIYYATTSLRLAKDVQRLLLRLNIMSMICRSASDRGHRDGFNVRIQGSSTQRLFMTDIGCFGRRGDVIPEAMELVARIQENPNVDLIPRDAIDIVRQEMGDICARDVAVAMGEKKKTNQGLFGSDQSARRLSRSRMKRFAKACSSEKLHNLATSDVFWDEVASVEPIGDQPVFDLTVPGCQNFVGDGVFLHNSLEQDADAVCFLHRKHHRESGTTNFIIDKARNDEGGTVNLTFRRETQTFTDGGEEPADTPEPEERKTKAPSFWKRAPRH